MNLEFSDEQIMLKEAARRFFDAKCSSVELRKTLDAGWRIDRSLWSEMADMGFLGPSIPEEFGGLGLGRLELCVIAEEVGRCLAPVPFGPTLYLAAEFLMAAGNAAQKSEWLPGIAAGEVIATSACADDCGLVFVQDRTSDRVVLDGRKAVVPYGDIADIALVTARETGDDTPRLFLVDLRQDGVTRVTLETVDPLYPMARLEFGKVFAERLNDADCRSLIDLVMDRAAVLLAFEQIGGADHALEMACNYARERMAFGRPIGSFQAIKHMLADMYVSAALARSNAYFAAWSLEAGPQELPLAAAVARVSATQAFRQCARNSIQAHGGMGFTWEVDCHLYYRRANQLAALIGGAPHWERLLVDRLSRTGTNGGADDHGF